MEFNYKENSDKKKNVKKILEIISNYEKTKKITDEEAEFIHEIIYLDFILKQDIDKSKSLNLLKNNFIKIIKNIIQSDNTEDARLILKYIVNLLYKKEYPSRLTKLINKL
jgi:hypothetical protein